MTLYLKYRSKNLDELDLANVREQLKKIAGSPDMPHAFLFAGPKGLGKTSAARILAKMLNCEHPGRDGAPCNKCKHCLAISAGSHMDVMELDAASNRGIDDVRALREAVKLAPAMGKKKVYIIDEAHMLTTEASNALLKTLEEPPEHSVFILATTNPEKLIETVRSRATNVLFAKPSKEELLRAIERVSQQESIKIEKPQMEAIADSSGGSFRDAIKILESFARGETDFLANMSVEENMDSIFSALLEKDAKKLLARLEDEFAKGVAAERMAEKMLARLHEAILAASGLGGRELSADISDLVVLAEMLGESASRIKYALIPELPLELAVVSYCNGIGGGKAYFPPPTAPKEPRERTNETPKQEVKAAMTDTVKFDTSLDIGKDSWNKLITLARPRNRSVEALLRAARPLNYDGNTLTLGVYYSFHKERIEANPHRQILDELIKEVFGKSVRVVCTLTEASPQEVQAVRRDEGVVLTESEVIPQGASLTQGDGGDIIKAAKEIFGG